ncbi:hypothetical protein TeGR_g14152 [Tetraparma gracilis]|uniref:F-box domain-containing protein n=1 Tax=Tetraparma gracilis TaxID=2962635 RepID=A0ABQ6MZD7_9STRA|nr:hypothetical protein TeGR_g14152 [Tetraparma gracilis]
MLSLPSSVLLLLLPLLSFSDLCALSLTSKSLSGSLASDPAALQFVLNSIDFDWVGRVQAAIAGLWHGHPWAGTALGVRLTEAQLGGWEEMHKKKLGVTAAFRAHIRATRSVDGFGGGRKYNLLPAAFRRYLVEVGNGGPGLGVKSSGGRSGIRGLALEKDSDKHRFFGGLFEMVEHGCGMEDVMDLSGEGAMYYFGGDCMADLMSDGMDEGMALGECLERLHDSFEAAMLDWVRVVEEYGTKAEWEERERLRKIPRTCVHHVF